MQHTWFVVWCAIALYMVHTATAQGQELLTDNPLRTGIDSLVDASVREYFRDSRAVGLSIGIVQGNQTHYYNYGETEYGNGSVPTNRTIYEIGSMTKSFTGILLAQAVLDDKVHLDDDVRTYLKGEYFNLEYEGEPIRIVHLANHTSRIPRLFPNLWERKEYDSLNPFSTYSKELLFEGLHRMTMDTLPGVVNSYSNMGVALLGCILEDVYNEEYVALLSKFVLAPLHMADTKIGISALDTNRLAKAHNAQRKPIPYWDVPAIAAIGALRSNTADLTKYIRANIANATKSIALSHELTFGTPQKGMGLNWFLYTTRDGYTVVEHGGGTGGSRSSLQCFPELRAGFVILTNSVANRNELEKELASIIAETTRR